VWSWDITYLTTTVTGMFFYLYLILDVPQDRRLGGLCPANQRAGRCGFPQGPLREGGGTRELLLHSDNGSPMKGATLLATLQRLGVVPSFSRPSVSNDNPYSEALFKTCKYHPGFPEKPFENLEKAREWVAGFVGWYNEEHRHSGIRFVTPGERHPGPGPGHPATTQGRL
jgi:putative transposase